MLLLLSILVMVLLQVLQRYIPGEGIPPTGELARLSMVWVTFVLAGYLMAHDRHIAIHVVDYFLPIRVLGVVQLLASIVVLLACLGMAYATWDLIATDRGQVTAEARSSAGPRLFRCALRLLVDRHPYRGHGRGEGHP